VIFAGTERAPNLKSLAVKEVSSFKRILVQEQVRIGTCSETGFLCKHTTSWSEEVEGITLPCKPWTLRRWKLLPDILHVIRT
jgi:hypothetical protein